MNVLVIPEDFRMDQYILKPVFERLFRSFGRRQARVQVCSDPLLGGVGEALSTKRLSEIMGRYQGMIQVFILCVDRDGKAGRRTRLDRIESALGDGRTFLAENAWEELETWALAGLTLPSDWNWADVRAEIHVKERYFEPLAVHRGVADGPGGGRKVLGKEAARRIPAIRRKCPDDFDALAQRLESLT